MLDTLAVVLEGPERLSLSRLPLTAPDQNDLIVDVDWSGVSTGTERLLFTGAMPPFPGMGYPLVPGYETVGRIAAEPPPAGRARGLALGDRVFVPGARCYGAVKGLFGGAAARLVVAADKVVPLGAEAFADSTGVLLALAATAHHALVAPGARLPDLIVGHGVLGRLLARLSLALGGEAPVVFETSAARRAGAEGYLCIDPADEARRDFLAIVDATGDAGLLDDLIGRLARGGEITLAGFYHEPIRFAFPPAFMREARLRIAAEWQPADMAAVQALVASRRLSLAGLITHHRPASEADSAYRQAFGDPSCLKMVLDWRTLS